MRHSSSDEGLYMESFTAAFLTHIYTTCIKNNSKYTAQLTFGVLKWYSRNSPFVKCEDISPRLEPKADYQPWVYGTG
jgi:hypothetical protein